jgi:hypothetical protein
MARFDQAPVQDGRFTLVAVDAVRGFGGDLYMEVRLWTAPATDRLESLTTRPIDRLRERNGTGRRLILAFDHRGRSRTGGSGSTVSRRTMRPCGSRTAGADLRGPRAGARGGAGDAGGWWTSSSALRSGSPTESGRGMKHVPVEKSGRRIRLPVRDEFGDHIERFDPDFIRSSTATADGDRT